MTDLLDVNVLVSLAWPNHVHHEAARAWFAHARPGPWATTPITECGFVRVSSNRAVVEAAVLPNEAVALLERIQEVDGHVFLPDDLDATRMVSYRAVTDAHLLALARRHGARFVTFDRAIARLAGRSASDVVVIEP